MVIFMFANYLSNKNLLLLKELIIFQFIKINSQI
jgi:hypothetical protein